MDDAFEVAARSKLTVEFDSAITALIFADSHGAFDKHLGAGWLYYALPTMLRSQVCVCIGSGGGFVPRLIRKAQADLGLTHARTYLVDANLGDLGFGSPVQGGGWLGPDNDLRQAQTGVTILQMLSADAARLFGAHGITIDYLHIDGDHSRRGVVADVSDYVPLLSRGAVVTLHDVRMPSVAAALDDLRRDAPDLQIVTFPEIGAGTAILRLPMREIPARLGIDLAASENPNRTIDLPRDAVDASARLGIERATFERWHYLATDAYRSRYRLVADLLDKPNLTVVEIGGFPNSVVDVLRQAKKVIAMEAYLPDGYRAEVEASAAARGIEYQAVHAGSLDLPPGPLGRYALVALGIDLTSGCRSPGEIVGVLDKLVLLAEGAEVVAIEGSEDMPFRLHMRAVELCLAPKRLLDLTLDLTSDPVAEDYFVKDGRGRRRVLVIQPQQRLSAEARAAILAPIAVELAALQAAASEPQSLAYTLGQEVHFTGDGTARPFLRAGWAHPEKAHTWMTGATSLMQFRPVSADGEVPGGDLALTMHVRPLVVPGKIEGQRLKIFANEWLVLDTTLTGQDQAVTCRIPHRAFARDPLIRLSLAHPDARAPAEVIAGNADRKLLSIAVRTMTLDLERHPL